MRGERLLTGTHLGNVDEKGRINFPAKLRGEMGELFYITKWLDDCIVAFPTSQWERISEILGDMPIVKSREIRRFLYSNAVEVAPDKQGRILVPNSLREHAMIKKELVIIGVGTHAEIWSQDRWEQANSEMKSQKVSEIMSMLDF